MIQPINDKITGKNNNFLKWLGVIILVYFLIVAVTLISSGSKLSLGERAEELFTFATNPFAGLIVGIMATALIQSSSTVTSIIVGLVAPCKHCCSYGYGFKSWYNYYKYYC